MSVCCDAFLHYWRYFCIIGSIFMLDSRPLFTIYVLCVCAVCNLYSCAAIYTI